MATGDDTLLRIYLNDHLAGATAGTELARRLSRNRPGDKTLHQLAEEINEDRQTLLTLMASLNAPVRVYKTWAAWALEKASRLKLNGLLANRSPLSHLVELELLRLGVEGKAAGWRTLRARTEQDPRLDKHQLDTLLDRAQQQRDHLEDLRVQAAHDAFG